VLAQSSNLSIKALLVLAKMVAKEIHSIQKVSELPISGMKSCREITG
jgi:hypothetical protein